MFWVNFSYRERGKIMENKVKNVSVHHKIQKIQVFRK